MRRHTPAHVVVSGVAPAVGGARLPEARSARRFAFSYHGAADREALQRGTHSAIQPSGATTKFVARGRRQLRYAGEASPGSRPRGLNRWGGREWEEIHETTYRITVRPGRGAHARCHRRSSGHDPDRKSTRLKSNN